MACRVSRTILLVLLACSAAPAHAQFRWNGDGTVEWVGPDRRYIPPQALARPSGPSPFAVAPLPPADEVRDGGPRPDIQPLAPPVVAFPHAYPASSIVIDVQARQLYFVLPGNVAFAYQISVGREGFGWTGTEAVARKQAWPDWHPPAEMRQRDPRLPVKMTGGIDNPLGAMALYLGNTLYRIHGTNDEKTLGQAASSGCFRMMNAGVLHLASITEIGTKVHVVEALAPPQRVSGVQAGPVRPPAQYQSQSPPPARPMRRDMWYEWDRGQWGRDPGPFSAFPSWR